VFDLFTFGETMLRLAAPHQQRLEQVTQLDVQVGGAESNVASNLARLGHQTGWFSRLPTQPLGRMVSRAIAQHGVDVSSVRWVDDARLGLYFLEYAPEPRGIHVLYDRKDSAMSQLTKDELPYDAIKQARWLHLTGITAALGASCAESVSAVIGFAHEHGVKVSFDVNYRAKLWSPEAAAATLAPLCAAADVVFVAARDAQALFGTQSIGIARDLSARWGNTVFVTQGDHPASACAGEAEVEAAPYTTTIVDRVGAGDAFASGVLHGLLSDKALEQCLRYGLALAALKLTIRGDVALVTRQELEEIVARKTSSAPRR
jgi:2-dehydro-3-deoxygluconokinase